MAIALHHSRAKGAAKLMLIGIANHDGDGGSWPSLHTLMKYAGITDRRSAQRLLRQLEGFGEIRCYVSQGGDHSTADYLRPNLYKFTLECPHDCNRKSNHKTRRDQVIQAELEIDPAVAEPPGGLQTAPPRGLQTAQTKQVNHLSLVVNTATDARGVDMDALARAAVESPVVHVETPAERYQRLMHERCPGHRSGRHDFRIGDRCGFCMMPRPSMHAEVNS